MYSEVLTSRVMFLRSEEAWILTGLLILLLGLRTPTPKYYY